MKVTLEHLVALFPNTPKATLEQYVEPINTAIEEWEINNVPMFLAQCGHESMGFKAVKENLNYSANGLVKTFPKYFNAATAKLYARKPEAIANKVYANRLGNGSEASGDGWAHRGRGVIQLTGRANYEAFAEALEGMTHDLVIPYLETPQGAVDAAGWYWNEHNINQVSNDVTKTTLKINGGTIGLAERKALYLQACKLFS